MPKRTRLSRKGSDLKPKARLKKLSVDEINEWAGLVESIDFIDVFGVSDLRRRAQFEERMTPAQRDALDEIWNRVDSGNISGRTALSMSVDKLKGLSK